MMSKMDELNKTNNCLSIELDNTNENMNKMNEQISENGK